MLRANGRGGRLTVAGRPVAQLGEWHMETTGGGWVLSADVESVDEYWTTSTTPMTLHLTVSTNDWRWKRTLATFSGDTVTVTGEGKPEVIRGEKE